MSEVLSNEIREVRVEPEGVASAFWQAGLTTLDHLNPPVERI